MARDRYGQIFAHTVFVIYSIICILPFVLLVSASFTDETEIIQNGYAFIPKVFSTEAYEYLWNISATIGRAYLITIFVTVVGTTCGLIIISLLAYPMSRKDLPLRNFFAFFVFFTLLFNGGLVPSYLVYTQIFNAKNTLFALIFPNLLLNGFYVLLMRTFFSTTIPDAVIESANIDGASEIKIWYKIVLPLSLPVLATVGLFQGLAYWNDWFNGLIYLTDSKLYSLQNLLNRIILDLQYITNNHAMLGGPDIVPSVPMESVRMAMAVIGIVPIICAYPFFQKYFVKGLTIGAVKG